MTRELSAMEVVGSHASGGLRATKVESFEALVSWKQGKIVSILFNRITGDAPA